MAVLFLAIPWLWLFNSIKYLITNKKVAKFGSLYFGDYPALKNYIQIEIPSSEGCLKGGVGWTTISQPRQ